MENEKLTIDINTHIKKELDYLCESLNKDKKSNLKFENTEHLINYILSSVADGSRKPGAYERTILEKMSIVPSLPIFSKYRREYGEPMGQDELKQKFIRSTKINNDILDPFKECMKCGWIGQEENMTCIPTNFGTSIMHKCPECSCIKFHILEIK